MGRFLRSNALRNALWLHQNGKCATCGNPLPPDGWHADHVIPWSQRKVTNVHDMQALCAACNLKKGSKVMGDRAHQAELREAISRTDASDLPLRILAWVVPGGGKSRLPGILAQAFPNHKIGWFVPRLSLQLQAVESMRKDFGIELRDAANDIDPRRGKRGFVATHAALMEQPDLWRKEFAREKYILIVDESHHAKVEKLSGHPRPLASALSRLSADVWLNMTGTINTNDGTRIWDMYYEDVAKGIEPIPAKSAKIYIRYSRMTALGEEAIVPIEFFHHDGIVEWKPAGKEKKERLSQVDRDDESAAIFTALRTAVAQQLFESGLSHWRANSRGGKLIVVVDRQETAREYEKKLKRSGLQVALAIDDNPSAHDEVRRFRNHADVSSLVTCQMAYEGLDVPSASHLICLTHIRSAPWIEQMLARVWRAHPGKKRCWAFVPDDPRMNRVIEKIQSEKPDVLGVGEPGGTDGGPLPSPVLAISGSVDDVWQQFLDMGYEADEMRDVFMECIRNMGLTGDEPQVRALLQLVREKNLPSVDQPTTKELEQSLRKQIHKLGNNNDRKIAERRGIDVRDVWGETLTTLKNRTGKSIKEMNEEELKRAWSTLQSICLG